MSGPRGISRGNGFGIVHNAGRPRLNRDASFALNLDRVVQPGHAMAVQDLRDVRLVPAEMLRGFALHEAPPMHPVLELFDSVLHAD